MSKDNSVTGYSALMGLLQVCNRDIHRNCPAGTTLGCWVAVVPLL